MRLQNIAWRMAGCIEGHVRARTFHPRFTVVVAISAGAIIHPLARAVDSHGRCPNGFSTHRCALSDWKAIPSLSIASLRRLFGQGQHRSSLEGQGWTRCAAVVCQKRQRCHISWAPRAMRVVAAARVGGRQYWEDILLRGVHFDDLPRAGGAYFPSLLGCVAGAMKDTTLRTVAASTLNGWSAQDGQRK